MRSERTPLTPMELFLLLVVAATIFSFCIAEEHRILAVAEQLFSVNESS